MNCREVIDVLAEYLEMTLSPDVLGELEAHLAGCVPCQAYLATYRRTRELAAASDRATLPPAMPPEMKGRLRAFLVTQLLRQDG
jgi:anti-sigma factor RsiW